MKINIKLMAIVLGSLLLVAGCGEPSSDSREPEQSSQAGTNESSSANSSADQKLDSQSESEAGSLNQGQKIKCEFDMAEGGQQQVGTFWLGEKGIRAEYQVASQNFSMVFNREASYFWGDGLEMALKISAECQDQLVAEDSPEEGEEQETPLVRGPEHFQSWAESRPEGVTCQEYSGEIDLELPDNIQFLDQCELLQQQREMYKNIPDLKNLSSE
jgi:hypothetical protein